MKRIIYLIIILIVLSFGIIRGLQWLNSRYFILEYSPGNYWQRVSTENYCMTDPSKSPITFYVDENFEVTEGGGCSKNSGKRKNAIYEYLKEHKEHPTIWYGTDHPKGISEWDDN